MKLVIATNNPHKTEEIKSVIPSHFSLQSLKEIGCNDDIPETGSTLEENALIKAKYVFFRYHLNCFADDTGLEVEALNGKPGVYSARYAGEPKNDENNIQKLLKDLDGIENRNAQFRSVIALIYNDKEYLFEGVMKGRIINEKKGNNGFGYDSVFIPDGYSKTFAEMSMEDKNKISHRAIAVKKLVDFLHSI